MNISIIDDERLLTNNISKKLIKNGYNVSKFYSCNDFLQNGDEFSQLYLIDLSLGDGSGFDIIKWLRIKKKSKAPIIIMSCYNDTENKVYGLDLGADDYISKPIIPNELIARVRAILRRPIDIIDTDFIHYKDVQLDRKSKQVLIKGKNIHLTKKEALIVELFILKQGLILDKDSIIKHIWGSQSTIDVTDNTINVTISNVRKKLGGKFKFKTLVNKGYILE